MQPSVSSVVEEKADSASPGSSVRKRANPGSVHRRVSPHPTKSNGPYPRKIPLLGIAEGGSDDDSNETQHDTASVAPSLAYSIRSSLALFSHNPHQRRASARLNYATERDLMRLAQERYRESQQRTLAMVGETIQGQLREAGTRVVRELEHHAATRSIINAVEGVLNQTLNNTVQTLTAASAAPASVPLSAAAPPAESARLIPEPAAPAEPDPEALAKTKTALRHTIRLFNTILFLLILEAAFGAGIGFGLILAQSIFIITNNLSGFDVSDLRNSVGKASLMAFFSALTFGIYMTREYHLGTAQKPSESYSGPMPLQSRINTLDKITQSMQFENFLHRLSQNAHVNGLYYCYKPFKYLGNCFTTLYTATTWASLLAMMFDLRVAIPKNHSGPWNPDDPANPLKFFQLTIGLVPLFFVLKLNLLALQDLSKRQIKKLSAYYDLGLEQIPPTVKLSWSSYTMPILLGLLEGFTFGSFLGNEIKVAFYDYRIVQNHPPLYQENSATDLLIRSVLGIIFALGVMFRNVLETQYRFSILKFESDKLKQWWHKIQTYVNDTPQVLDDNEFKEWHSETEAGTQADPLQGKGEWPKVQDLISLGQSHQIIPFKRPDFWESVGWVANALPMSSFMMISIEITGHLWGGSIGHPITSSGEVGLLIFAWVISLATHMVESSRGMRFNNTLRMIETRRIQIEEQAEALGLDLDTMLISPHVVPTDTPVASAIAPVRTPRDVASPPGHRHVPSTATVTTVVYHPGTPKAGEMAKPGSGRDASARLLSP